MEDNASMGLRCVLQTKGVQSLGHMRQELNAQRHVDAVQKPAAPKAAGGRGKKAEGGAAKQPGDYMYCKRVSADSVVRSTLPNRLTFMHTAAKRKGAAAKKDSDEELSAGSSDGEEETFELSAPSPAVAPKVGTFTGVQKDAVYVPAQCLPAVRVAGHWVTTYAVALCRARRGAWGRRPWASSPWRARRAALPPPLPWRRCPRSGSSGRAARLPPNRRST